MLHNLVARSSIYCVFLTVACQLTCVRSHAHLTFPPPRGALAGSQLDPSSEVIDKNAPRDYSLHFPAGDRGDEPGSGARSQVRLAGNWTLFEPLDPNFRWRAGVCGDKKARLEAHRRSGRYYFGGKVSATFTEGAVVSLQASIVGHHNGFFQFHICNVSQCDGEISRRCFRRGACRRLLRAENAVCDELKNRWCGPIQKSYPGRWYLPCPDKANKGGVDHYGGEGEMKYRLPKGLTCENCVIHWEYNTANTCNPPGTVDYFEGDDRPDWGDCEGQSGAVGGYASWPPTCGGERFSEEYYNCADVRIVPS